MRAIWKLLQFTSHNPVAAVPPAIADVVAGRTTFYMAPINTVVGQMKDGKLAATKVGALPMAGLKDFIDGNL